jgi:hypothetical protein
MQTSPPATRDKPYTLEPFLMAARGDRMERTRPIMVAVLRPMDRSLASLTGSGYPQGS